MKSWERECVCEGGGGGGGGGKGFGPWGRGLFLCFSQLSVVVCVVQSKLDCTVQLCCPGVSLAFIMCPVLS